MFAMTCSSERLPGGEFQVLANENWRLKVRKPVILKGALADLWEQLSAVAELSHQEQRSLLKQMDPRAKASLIVALSKFQRSGWIQFKAEYKSPAETLARPQLVKLHLELTHRCNFQCTACYLGSRLQRPGADASAEGTTEQWVRTIDEAGELGCTFATVTGGEPFLRQDVLTILRALSENGIIAEVNTNASPISRSIARQLRTLLISNVAVSLYGYDPQSAHEYSGNAPGHRASIDAIHHLAEAQVPLHVKYFATRGNVAGYEGLCRELEPIGIKPVLSGHAIHADIFDGNGLGHAEDLTAQDLPRLRVVQGGDLPCHPTGTVLNIEPDGRIRACPKVSVHFGNVFRDGLRHVWERSSEMAGFRAFWIDYCKTAGFEKGTKHDVLCPAAAMLSRPEGLTQFRRQWQATRDRIAQEGAATCSD
jgi:MoaA/NifB/PqqE/SkfB family radical SAM enzyme